MFKRFVQKRLEKYVVEYFKAHPEVKLVAVAGSVGKTSTKTAIATVLSRQLRVRMDNSNHNTHMSAPLGILGVDYPENVHNIMAWLAIFSAAKRRIKESADVDVIVQELGTDHPGEIAHFGTYLKPNIGVITAVTPEHMEFFKTIEAVAEEEMTLANISELAIINRDDIDSKYAADLTNPSIVTYGSTSAAEYHIEIDNFELAHGFQGKLIGPDFKKPLAANIRVLGEHSLRPATAAFVVAAKLHLSEQNIIDGVEDITPVKGRMNVLRGINGSVLIDDSYNSSPASAAAALQVIYRLEAPQRIAILGSMNELGEVSESAHTELGNLCDPALLSWVVTVGDDAEKYLAPAARARGCQVKSFKSALDAGAFVKSVLEPNAVVLAKGSQGDVYLEEALKILLHETHEDHELVRQSASWLKIKQDFFSKIS